MKRMFLFMPMAALILAACNNSSAPTASVSTINGTTQGYAGGAATVKLLASGAGPTPESPSNPALSSAPISAAGAFTLALPSGASLSPYLSVTGTAPATPTNCTGGLTISDPTAQGYSVNSLIVGNTVIYSNVLVSSSATSATVNGKSWAYLDRPTTLRGTVNCTGSSNGVTTTTTTAYDAAFRQGWNILSLNATTTLTASSYNTTLNASLSSDGPSVWNTSSSPSTQSLDPQATVARNAVLKAVAFFR